MNVNDSVWVELSPYGEELWAQKWDASARIYGETGVPAVIRNGNTEANGRVRFQIHDLMLTFGWVMWMGNTRGTPFKNNRIYLSRDEVPDQNPDQPPSA